MKLILKLSNISPYSNWLCHFLSWKLVGGFNGLFHVVLFILSLDGICYSSKRIIYLQCLQQMFAHRRWPWQLYTPISPADCPAVFRVHYSAPHSNSPALLCLLHRMPACSCVLCSIPLFLSKIKAPQQGVLCAQVGSLVSLWKCLLVQILPHIQA